MSEGFSSIDAAWQSVALEERLELLSKAQASGTVAALAAMWLMGSIAYGFDQIWLLATGVGIAVFLFPLFSSYCWRRGKPALILAYLAIRAVGRRYAYGHGISDLDIILIYRGKMREIYEDPDEIEVAKQLGNLDSNNNLGETMDVWIMLLRTGVVVMQERLGGAKLVFLTPINHETVVREPLEAEEGPEGSVTIEGVNISKGRKVLLWSKYPGAHYVFSKQLEGLIFEQQQIVERQLRFMQNTV